MGRSVRPSVRLDQQQMAALEAAAARNGTTVSALLRQGAEQVTAGDAPTVARLRRWDAQSGLLVALLGELDDLGMGDAMPDVRRLLARAEQVRAAAASEAARAQDGRAGLVDQLVAGQVGAGEAAQRDLEFALWLDGDRPALRLSERALAELGGEARRAAVGGAGAVHRALVERVDAAVATAVEAGGRIVDVRRMVDLLAPAWQRRGQVGSIDQHGIVAADPWRDAALKLPGLSMEDLQGDADRLEAWAASTAAMADLDRLWKVADLLGEVCGCSFDRFAKDVSGDVLHLVERDLPRQVWFAVVAGCGWRPGLLMAAGRIPVPPADNESRLWAWGASVLGIGR
ncbi:hypothetical protein [Micromonospora aurantiaca (nom. illeg.)]|uniref:hypothetical protein n=1 Tax=Micromonospora aurantiaca (nom. illeg.) TaxID=47850 RepID=UPI00379249CC